jgi:hypothetical protein
MEEYYLINIKDDFPREKIKDLIIEMISRNAVFFTGSDSINNPKFDYFAGYIKDIKVRTVILETRYNDKQYIEDYGKYYFRSF